MKHPVFVFVCINTNENMLDPAELLKRHGRVEAGESRTAGGVRGVKVTQTNSEASQRANPEETDELRPAHI